MLLNIALRPGLYSAAVKPVNISLADFTVQSKNPQFEYIGKGFTEFISIDLAKSRQVTLIDREKRIELLKEQAFTLSGAADEKTNIAIGKLLSADYLITGNIFDLLDSLTVTFRISNTTTGEIVFEDKVTDKLSKYDRISSQAAEKILSYLKIRLPKALVAKANMPQAEKSAEVAINFSKAVDAYDRKDFTKAEAELKAAKKLDPENTAVNIYINKLFVNTTKFKVMPEFYVSYQNPAYLGLIKQDKAYLAVSSMGDDKILRSMVAGVVEQADKFGAGYFFPLLKGLGVGVEGTAFSTKDMIYGSGWSRTMVMANNQVSYSGVVLTAGLRLSDYAAIGAGYTSYSENRNYYISRSLINDGVFTTTQNPYQTPNDKYADKKTSGLGAATFGFLLKNRANTLFLDSYYAATDQKTEYYDTENGNFVEYRMPATQETTLTWAFNRKRTFIVVKETNYIYPSGMDTYRWNITPAVEHWFSSWLALRAGTEYSQLLLAGRKQAPGNGYTAGATLSLRHLLDIDLNFTNRTRPSRNLNSLMMKEKVIFLTFSTNSGIFSGSGK